MWYRHKVPGASFARVSRSLEDSWKVPEWLLDRKGWSTAACSAYVFGLNGPRVRRAWSTGQRPGPDASGHRPKPIPNTSIFACLWLVCSGHIVYRNLESVIVVGHSAWP